MTTRGYEHQRGLQAQEGQTKAREADEMGLHSRDHLGSGKPARRRWQLITIYRGAAA